jgi:hypothetical protein
MDAEAFFITQSIAYARSLPLKDAGPYLRGMMGVCQEMNGLSETVRKAAAAVSESDRQLQLIETGQLKLALN